jgi:cation transport regulator
MYESIDDIADYLKDDLPEGAQEIYLEHYQESWENYEEHQGGDLDQHGVAHRDAMIAVKKDYIKDKEGTWHLRSEYEAEHPEEEGLTTNFDIRDTGDETTTEDVEDDKIEDTDDAAVDEDGDPSTAQDDKPISARH